MSKQIDPTELPEACAFDERIATVTPAEKWSSRLTRRVALPAIALGMGVVVVGGRVAVDVAMNPRKALAVATDRTESKQKTRSSRPAATGGSNPGSRYSNGVAVKSVQGDSSNRKKPRRNALGNVTDIQGDGYGIAAIGANNITMTDSAGIKYKLVGGVGVNDLKKIGTSSAMTTTTSTTTTTTTTTTLSPQTHQNQNQNFNTTTTTTTYTNQNFNTSTFMTSSCWTTTVPSTTTNGATTFNPITTCTSFPATTTSTTTTTSTNQNVNPAMSTTTTTSTTSFPQTHQNQNTNTNQNYTSSTWTTTTATTASAGAGAVFSVDGGSVSQTSPSTTNAALVNPFVNGFGAMCIDVARISNRCGISNSEIYVGDSSAPTLLGTNNYSFGDMSTIVNGETITMRRSAFVPTNASFIRWTSDFTNSGTTSVTFRVGSANQLTSGSNTTIFTTSSGDSTADGNDYSLVSWGGSGSPLGSARVGTVFGGPEGVGLSDIAYLDGDGMTHWGYSITVAPGETRSIVNFVVIGGKNDVVSAATDDLVAGLNASQWDQLTDSQRANVVNFVVPPLTPATTTTTTTTTTTPGSTTTTAPGSTTTTTPGSTTTTAPGSTTIVPPGSTTTEPGEVSYNEPTPATEPPALPATGTRSTGLVNSGVGIGLLGAAMAAFAARRRKSLAHGQDTES
ncbi:hypothetical protein MCETE7_00160 [Acidimicrobiia bacterium]